MLQELIKRLSQGGAFSIHSLAKEFDVSYELIETMLAELVRSGRLRLLESCDQGTCGSCGEEASCKPRGKMWMLTGIKSIR